MNSLDQVSWPLHKIASQDSYLDIIEDITLCVKPVGILLSGRKLDQQSTFYGYHALIKVRKVNLSE